MCVCVCVCVCVYVYVCVCVCVCVGLNLSSRALSPPVAPTTPPAPRHVRRACVCVCVHRVVEEGREEHDGQAQADQRARVPAWPSEDGQ
jgi:hypothetical protein